MAGLSFGQAMEERLRGSKVRQEQDWQKINDEYQIGMLNAMKPSGGAGGGGGKPQGLAAAKTPTFSNLGTMTGGSGLLPDSSAPASLPINEGQPGSGTIGRTLYSTDAAGQTTIPTREGYQTDGAGIPEVKDDGLGTVGLKEGGIIERVGNMLGLRKPSEAPQQNANRVADQFGGLSGEAVRSLRARPRQIEEELKKQGLRKGKTRVTDPNGSPTEDTVDAKLADGEAVLNAGAAEMLGRDEIERLNAAGAEKLGLRCGGGPKMVGGVMHAAGGTERIKVKEVRDALKLRPTTEQLLGEADDVMKQSDELYKGGQARTPSAAVPRAGVTPPAISLRGVGAALGGALNYGGYMATPEEDKVAAMPGFGPMGAVVGLAGRALQPLRDKLYAPAYAKGEELMGGLKERVGNVMPQGPSQQMSPGDARLAMRSAEPQYTQQVPVPTGYVQPSPARDAAQAVGNADEAAFSKFFNEQGITDEMRKSGKGLRQINVPGSTDQIYRRGNEYVGMGAPSRIAAEKAKAEDPVLKRAAAMEEMRQYALQGNENAAKMYNQMLEQDSAREVEGLRTKADIEAAGLKGSGKKGGSGDDTNLKLSEQINLAEQALGEGGGMKLLGTLDQMKRGGQAELVQKMRAAKTPEERELLRAQWDALESGATSQDQGMKALNVMKLRSDAAEDSAPGRAGLWGAAGTVAGGALGALAGLKTKNKKLMSTGLGAMAGGLGLGGYGYKTGTHGVDEYTDPNALANLQPDGKGNLVDPQGRIVIPVGMLEPESQVWTGQR